MLLMGSGVQITKCGVCLAVEGLTRDAALLRVVADGTALAEEDNSGTGEPQGRGYDAHRRE